MPSSVFRVLGSAILDAAVEVDDSARSLRKTAGDVPGAIEILTAGGQRFPAEHASFVDAIGALNAAPLDPAQVQRLKALGYL